MSGEKTVDRTDERRQAWEDLYAKAVKKYPERLPQFNTLSN